MDVDDLMLFFESATCHVLSQYKQDYVVHVICNHMFIYNSYFYMSQFPFCLIDVVMTT